MGDRGKDSGGQYTAMCPRPRHLPSPWDMCVVLLVILQWFSSLVLAVQAKKPTFITCAGTLQWGLSVQAFRPVSSVRMEHHCCKGPNPHRGGP